VAEQQLQQKEQLQQQHQAATVVCRFIMACTAATIG